MRDRRRLGAAADVELGEDPRHVHARGLLGHEELRADLAVRRAAGEQREHLALARREAERVLVAGAVRARRRRAAPRELGSASRARPASPSASPAATARRARSRRGEHLGELGGRRLALAAPPASASARRSCASARRVGARDRRQASAAAASSAGSAVAARARQVRARRRRAAPSRPAARRRRTPRRGRRSPRRARSRVALGVGVAEVAGALGGVGLDRGAGLRQPRDPRQVLGAELDRVEPVVDRGARGDEVAAAALELAAQRAVLADELRLARARDERRRCGRATRAPRRGRRRRARSPRAAISTQASVMPTWRRSGGGSAARAAAQSPSVPRISTQRQRQPVARRGPRRRCRRAPARRRRSASCGAADEVQRVGEVRPRAGRARSRGEIAIASRRRALAVLDVAEQDQPAAPMALSASARGPSAPAGARASSAASRGRQRLAEAALQHRDLGLPRQDPRALGAAGRPRAAARRRARSSRATSEARPSDHCARDSSSSRSAAAPRLALPRRPRRAPRAAAPRRGRRRRR